MRFDCSAAEFFLDALEAKRSWQDVWSHPAYQAVQAHARRFEQPLQFEDLERALRGEPSPFYGLHEVDRSLEPIRRSLSVVQEWADRWMHLAEQSVARLFPMEDLSELVIYPIIGYDMGIGLDETVCLNLNWPPYWKESEEILYYAIHEVFHVLYQRHHSIPVLANVRTPAQWVSYLALWLQNEGMAVYLPWPLRRQREHLGDPDYQTLADSEQMHRLILRFWQVKEELQGSDLTREERIDRVFGRERLTYRVGAEWARRIEDLHGLHALRQTFFSSPEEALECYGTLLDRPCQAGGL